MESESVDPHDIAEWHDVNEMARIASEADALTVEMAGYLLSCADRYRVALLTKSNFDEQVIASQSNHIRALWNAVEINLKKHGKTLNDIPFTIWPRNVHPTS